MVWCEYGFYLIIIYEVIRPQFRVEFQPLDIEQKISSKVCIKSLEIVQSILCCWKNKTAQRIIEVLEIQFYKFCLLLIELK